MRAYEREDGSEGLQWWHYHCRSDAENYFSDWTKLKKPFKTHSIYSVCHNCKLIYYHHLENCPTCPGKFDRVSGTWEELAEKLKGYKLGPY